jgi:hypothetical protein
LWKKTYVVNLWHLLFFFHRPVFLSPRHSLFLVWYKYMTWIRLPTQKVIFAFTTFGWKNLEFFFHFLCSGRSIHFNSADPTRRWDTSYILLILHNCSFKESVFVTRIPKIFKKKRLSYQISWLLTTSYGWHVTPCYCVNI